MPIPKFSAELQRLYVAAGAPALGVLADAVTRRLKMSGSRESSPQGLRARISEWKNTTTPSQFGTVQLHLVRELVSRARDRGALGDLPVRDDEWHKIWRQTQAGASVEGAIDRCPYLGLASYTPDDVGRFHGRSRERDRLVKLALSATADNSPVVVVGDSGAGKSSLLAAGLVPALDCPWVIFTPGEDPGAALSAAFQHRGVPVTRRVVDDWTRARDARRVVIVVDQAEEIFTLCSSVEGRTAFIGQIFDLSGATSGIEIVVALGLRADKISSFLDNPQTAQVLENYLLFLKAIDREELRQVISAPAKLARLPLEQGLEDLAINELCGAGKNTYEAGALPLLSHALAETWRARSGDRLTIAAYNEVGGVQGALSTTAESMWKSMTPQTQAAARRILLKLVYVGEGLSDARRQRSRADLVDVAYPAAAETAIEDLTRARLLSVDADFVTLSHEIVLSGWERLRGWLRDNRHELLVQQRLQRDADEWARGFGGLYTGDRLSNAQKIVDNAEDDPGQKIRDFVAHSAKTVQRRQRRRHAMAAVGVATVAAIVVLAGVALAQKRTAEHAQASAELGLIIAAADRFATTDPTLSSTLLLAAQQRSPRSPEVASRLLTTEAMPLASEVSSGKTSVYTVAVSRDGKTLASASYDRMVRLWNIADPHNPRQIASLSGHRGFLTSVAFSPDGKTLASTSDDQTTRLWDLSDLAHPQLGSVLTGHQATVFYAQFSPDGRRLATVSYDRTVKLWDIAGARQARLATTMVGSEGPVRDLAWSPSGQWLATGSDDTTIRIWDTRKGTQVGEPLRRQVGAIHSLAWAPDGNTLASGSDDNTTQLWDVRTVTTPQAIGRPFGAQTGPLWAVNFSGDSRRLITGSLDGTVRVWSLDQPDRPRPMGRALSSSGGQVYGAIWLPDNRYVAAGSADGQIRIWQLPTTDLATDRGAPAISPDGDTAATGSTETGAITIWDTSRPSLPRVRAQTQPGAGIVSTALSPNGQLVAAGRNDGTVTLDDVSRNNVERKSVLQNRTRFINFVKFSPVGSILAMNASDSAVQLTDYSDPAHPITLSTFNMVDAMVSVNQFAFSSDGSTLVAGQTDGVVAVWNISNPRAPRLVARQKTAGSTVGAIAMSRSGIIATANSDIELWKLASDGLRKVGYAEGRSGIQSLVFSEDSRRLVSAADSQGITIWDTHQPDRIQSIIGPIASNSVAGRWKVDASSDASVVIGGGDNGSEIITVDTDAAARRICEQSSAYLTRERWVQAVPGIPYTSICR